MRRIERLRERLIERGMEEKNPGDTEAVLTQGRRLPQQCTAVGRRWTP